MFRLHKPCLFVLLPLLAPTSNAELIASFDSANYLGGDSLSIFPVDWSDAAEQPSHFWSTPAVTLGSGGFVRFSGWGTTIDPNKYVGFKVSAKAGYRLRLARLTGITTASNRISGTELTSYVWAYRVDDDKDGNFESGWIFGKTYTAADGGTFTDYSPKDWTLPAELSTKGTVEFAVFATAAAANRMLEPFRGILQLEGSHVPIGEIESYRHVASYQIPVEEASAVTYNWDTDTLFSIGDEGDEIVEFTKTGQKVSAMEFDPNINGGALNDPEGLNYLGGGKFLIGEERRATAVYITYDPSVKPTYTDLEPVSYWFGFANANLGLEGVAYDPLTDSVWGVREIGPAEIRQIPNFTAVRAGQPPAVRFPIERNRVTRICNQLSDIYIMAHSSYFPEGHPRRENILLLSRGDKKVLEITRAGKLVGVLDFSLLHKETVEGITMDKEGKIYLVSEATAGLNHSDLHVFEPTTPAPPAATPQQAFAVSSLRSSFESLGLDPALLFGSPDLVTAIGNVRQQGRTDVISRPENYGLFTETSIQDLRGTGVLIRVEGNEVNLSVPIQTSETIAGSLWEDAGVEMKATLPKAADKAFYRLTLPQN